MGGVISKTTPVFSTVVATFPAVSVASKVTSYVEPSTSRTGGEPQPLMPSFVSSPL